MTVRTNTPTKVPSVLTVPAGVSPDLRRYLEQLTETIEIRLGRRGDQRDRAITLRELIDSGLAKDLLSNPFDPNRSGNTGFVQPGDRLQDLAVPPAPTGFQANGAFSQVNLQWDYPAYANHSHTEVWRHDSDTIGDAILIGIQAGRIFVDPVGSGVTRYYWARHVNTDSLAGPFNSGSGTSATTATDVNHMLTLLTNEITNSQLASSLSTPIALIPSHTSGIAALDAFTGYSSSYTGDSLITRLGAVENSAANGVSSAQFSSEVTTRANADSALSQSITTLTSTVAGNTAGISSEATTRANADGALSTLITAVTATAAGNTGAITTEQTARASADSALSSSVSTVSSTVAGHTSSINTQATSINGLSGQYTVKIDVNGAVAGYGLASTTTAAGNIVSEFIVNADRFAIMRGGSNSTAATVPFIVQASATTINGESVPAGVYMADAFIKNGSIVAAKIGTLNADKITAGTISAARIAANTIDASKLRLDNSTIASQNIGGVPTVIIKDLGVGNAKIQNLAVSTLKIQNQAVTFPSASVTTTTLQVNHNNTANTWATIQTLTATFSGAPVMISGSFSVRSHNDQALMRYRLRRGTAVLFTSQTKAVRPTPDLFVIPYNFLDTNTSVGSRTYTLQAYVGDEYGYYSDRTIQTLETKK